MEPFPERCLFISGWREEVNGTTRRLVERCLRGEWCRELEMEERLKGLKRSESYAFSSLWVSVGAYSFIISEHKDALPSGAGQEADFERAARPHQLKRCATQLQLNAKYLSVHESGDMWTA